MCILCMRSLYSYIYIYIYIRVRPLNTLYIHMYKCALTFPDLLGRFFDFRAGNGAVNDVFFDFAGGGGLTRADPGPGAYSPAGRAGMAQESTCLR